MSLGAPRITLGLCLAFAACGGENTQPPPPPAPTLANVALDATPESLDVGSTLQLHATATSSVGAPMTGVMFTWSSSTPSKATVSSSGLVTALDTGIVRITAAASGHSDTAGFALVFVPVASISLTPVGDTVVPGGITRLTATARNDAGQVLADRTFSFTFSSSDASVAQVGADGIVTAVGPGAVTITARYDTLSATVQLLVPACSTKVVVSENAWSVPVVFGGAAPGISLTLAATAFSSTPVLYAAGLVVGTSTSTTLLGYSPLGGANRLPASPVCVMDGGAWTGNQRTFARMTLGDDDGGVAGLRITQETFANPQADGVLIFRYTFRNTSANAISGLRIGMFADWDLSFDGNATDDVMRKTPTAEGGEVLESDSTSHPAMVGLRALGSGTFTYLAWLNGEDATHTDYYGILGSGAVSSATISGDVRHLVGRGPFTLGPNGEVKVSFALVGGADRAAFTNALAASATLNTSLAGQ